jgi:hypothetical protein
MPTELVFIGGAVVVVAGAVVFAFLRRQKPAEPIHLR